jgi:signal transduction histidine kinase
VHSRRPLRWQRGLEFVLVNVFLAALCVVVFQGDPWRLPQLLLPLWIWAALRFQVLGSTVATFIVAVIGIGYTINGSGALDGLTTTQTVQLFQGMLAIVGLSVLVVAAATSERDAVRERLGVALRVEQEIGRHLRSVDELKDSMLAAVSHELRTPLTSILALAAMLQDRHDQLDHDKRREMYSHLIRESRRLDMLLADLLDLEQLRTGQLTPNFTKTRVDDVVRMAFERYSSLPREAKLDMEPVEVEADAAKVERIVDNLIGNAYKHTPAAGHVIVTVRATDGGALIAVDDDGKGVPDEAKVTIFEPFNRGDAKLAGVPGTGIGLSLVAHFTQLHGGRAWVEDRDGGGSSFRVYLPTHQDA